MLKELNQVTKVTFNTEDIEYRQYIESSLVNILSFVLITFLTYTPEYFIRILYCNNFENGLIQVYEYFRKTGNLTTEITVSPQPGNRLKIDMIINGFQIELASLVTGSSDGFCIVENEDFVDGVQIYHKNGETLYSISII